MRACVPMQTRLQAEGACADPVELEAALQQLKMTHMEQNRIATEAAGAHAESALQVVRIILLIFFLFPRNGSWEFLPRNIMHFVLM